MRLITCPTGMFTIQAALMITWSRLCCIVHDCAGWHSHYKTQYIDGLWGGLVINDPTEKKYAADLTMTATEWCVGGGTAWLPGQALWGDGACWCCFSSWKRFTGLGILCPAIWLMALVLVVYTSHSPLRGESVLMEQG